MPKSSTAPNRGIMMILSPAKTLDLSALTRAPLPQTTMPGCDPQKTAEVAQAMKTRSEGELKNLLGISAALAKSSHDYWKNFDVTGGIGAKGNTKPSIFCFSGAAYQGLDIHKRSDAALIYLQGNLRIIDPLYGVLRPMDLMQPYRLEMATKKLFQSNPSTKLAEYWKESVTKTLSQELTARSEPILLNLASDEYAAALDEKSLQGKLVKVVFRDQGRVVAIHAKRARGLMCKFLAENSIESLKDVQRFDEEGYAFVQSQSDDNTLIFDRTAKPRQARDASKPALKRAKR